MRDVPNHVPIQKVLSDGVNFDVFFIFQLMRGGRTQIPL